MGIVSYAQNFEDVLLHRVFGSTHYAFYVDIGAYDPVQDSVTKSFYDRGWDGINIEPGKIFSELAAARPRDINLNMAVYDRAGTIEFAQHPDHFAALSHVQAEPSPLSPTETVTSQPAFECRTIPCDTLANILARYASGRPIAFLKIDAEGSEGNIVRSTDWRTIRPTVILIEVTKPRSTVLDNQSWEPVLIEQGYLRAYFDGINCFYVPEERADLLRNFELPVNILDGFIRYDRELPAAQARAASAEARINKLTAELARTQAEQAQLLEQNASLQGELEGTQDRLEKTRQRLDMLAATQNEAVAAVVEANGYQVAGLRGHVAELETQNANLRRDRDALLGLRGEAVRLRRLIRDLDWPDGPGALRTVLPLARLLRRFAGTRVPPAPPEELSLLAPDTAVGVASSPVTAPSPIAAPAPPRRSIAKRAAWLAYRPFRPVGRPAALRLRAFLTMQIHSEFMQIDEKLNRLRDELARTSTSQLALGSQSSDPRLVELQTEIRQFGKLLENTLMTMAMDNADARRSA